MPGNSRSSGFTSSLLQDSADQGWKQRPLPKQCEETWGEKPIQCLCVLPSGVMNWNLSSACSLFKAQFSNSVLWGPRECYRGCKSTMMGAMHSETPLQPFFFLFFFFFFQDSVSLCSSGCLGTHFVDQAGLELRNSPTSAS